MFFCSVYVIVLDLIFNISHCPSPLFFIVFCTSVYSVSACHVTVVGFGQY
jgi:hypothetical protein